MQKVRHWFWMAICLHWRKNVLRLYACKNAHWKNTSENHCFEKLIGQLPIDFYLVLGMQGSFYLFIYDSGIGIAWKFNCFNGHQICNYSSVLLGFPIIFCFWLHFSHSLYTLWATASIIRLDIPAVFVTQSESLQARKTATVL